VPQEVSALFLSFDLSPVMVLTMVIIFYVILGMFLEPVSMTFITLPTIYPLMHAAGYDMIWFGIVYTITMEIAVLTPPVGLNLYVIQGISRGTIPIGDVIKGCLPFLACMVVLVGMVILIPDIALWLPSAMR
jgi:TRAP-type C4-dicarboxylate transport system permease large subunit